MRIAHIVPSMEERHGGPSKSVRALANHLAALGETVELLSTVEPHSPVTGTSADLATIRTFPRTLPRRLSPSTGLRHYLQRAEFDLVHNHALWLRPLHYARQIATRRGIPLVISPRGMLSGWSYRHHRYRKQLASWLVHPGAMAGADGWHATSAEEADDIRALGFRQPVCVSPNGVACPTDGELQAARQVWREHVPAVGSRPVALFYSRFHRKKRVRELIELWLSRPRGDWLLLVAGLAEEYTADELAREFAQAGDRVVICDSTGRPPPYAVASLFVLPSHSENFGLVIAEALAAGVPTLVTDTTPWSGLATEGAGQCVPWEGFAAALDAALQLPREELAAMGGRGRAWVARDYSWHRAATLLQAFYDQLRHARR